MKLSRILQYENPGKNYFNFSSCIYSCLILYWEKGISFCFVLFSVLRVFIQSRWFCTIELSPVGQAIVHFRSDIIGIQPQSCRPGTQVGGNSWGSSRANYPTHAPGLQAPIEKLSVLQTNPELVSPLSLEFIDPSNL